MTEKKMTPEQMREAIECQDQEDIKLCGAKIEMALAEFNCHLEAISIIRNAAVASRVEILKND